MDSNRAVLGKLLYFFMTFIVNSGNSLWLDFNVHVRYDYNDIHNEGDGKMNQIIETLLAHRSVRHFEDKPLSKEQIEKIVLSAQAASTSSFIQAY